MPPIWCGHYPCTVLGPSDTGQAICCPPVSRVGNPPDVWSRCVPYFIASYEYTDDAEARLLARPRHREFLSELGSTLVVSGPTDADGATLIFEAASAAEVAALLDADPFKLEGFIRARRVVGWTPVLGRWVESGLIS